MLHVFLAETPPPPPPQAVFALFELLKLLGLALAFGITAAWQGTFGAFFKWLGQSLNVRILGTHPFGFLSKAIDGAASRIQDFFGHLALAREPGFVTFLTWTNKVTKSQADELAAGTRDTAATLEYQQQVFVPWFVSARTQGIAKTAANATTTAKAASKSAAKVRAETKAVTTTATHTAKVVSRAHVATLPSSIAHVNDRVGTLERWERTATRDLTRLKNLAKPLAFAGAVAVALTRLGIGWIRCPQNKRFGKYLCGKPDWMLNAIIGALTFAVATEGIVPFAEQVQGIVGDAAKFSQRFWHASTIGVGGDRALGSSTLDRHSGG